MNDRKHPIRHTPVDHRLTPGRVASLAGIAVTRCLMRQARCKGNRQAGLLTLKERVHAITLAPEADFP
jgi:hypothetical protein